MSGTSGVKDCQGNQGCGIRQTGSRDSYGSSFNKNRGGYYAMERNNNFIKVWFWPRDDGDIPEDVKNGGSSVNTDAWVCDYIFDHDHR